MTDTSWLERLILVVLMAASAGCSGAACGRCCEAIRRARPTPDFSLRPLARASASSSGKWLLQGKVIRERPLAGLAHAFVFWGFCAFALVTVNHFAAGVRRPAF